MVTLGEGPAAHGYQLNVNSIHYFGVRNGAAELVRLKLPGVEAKTETAARRPAEARRLPGATGQAPPAEGIYKIPVAMLIDSADPRVQAAWEKRVRKRWRKPPTSSSIIAACGSRWSPWATGCRTLRSARSTNCMEFAQKVRPCPARLAIGFTTHYEWVRGEMHLGGTHGAPASHILIRESPGQVSEPERLEVLGTSWATSWVPPILRTRTR